jgi:MoaA/NifB/PqqE/SkfB family radical SAM enzyme
MYIQISTKCNMTCEHCGMNCTNEGEDMTFKTFKAALAMSCDSITIGGGEPTMHPQFEKFLLHAISHCDYVHLITNGKITETALMLAGLHDPNNDHQVLTVELSQDEYHDRINPEVIIAFEGRIRDTSQHLINAGRCDWGEDDVCICDGSAFIKPDGKAYQCGCDDSPCIGDVLDGFTPIDEACDDIWQCHKDFEGVETEEEAA